MDIKSSKGWAVVVAQLVERLLLTPEIRSSNPEIVKNLSTNCTIEKVDQYWSKVCGVIFKISR